jgi:hypothetical protein
MYSVSWRSCALVSAACCCVLTTAVSAATVTVTAGKVSISHGNGFAPITGSTSARPGDSVMTGVSGSAEIIYDNGCREPVRSGTVTKVAESPPCKAANGAPDNGWVTHTTEGPNTNYWPHQLLALRLGRRSGCRRCRRGSRGGGWWKLRRAAHESLTIPADTCVQLNFEACVALPARIQSRYADRES